jgi:hypothetical protein
MMTASVGEAGRRIRVDWRAEALVLALATAEATVLWLVVDMLLAATTGDEVRVPVGAVFVLVYLGTGLPRWLETLDVWDRVFAIAVVAAVTGSTLFAIKTASFPQIGWTDPGWLRESARAVIVRPNEARVPVWGMIATSAYAWWRGKTRAEPGPDAALVMLRVGTAAALIATAGESSVRPDGGTGATSGAVVLFFAAALAAVAIARLRADAGGGTAGLGSRWLGSMLAPVLAVTVGAVVVAGILSRDLLDTVLWFLAPLVWALSVVFRIVILALALVAFILISPILWLLSRHPIDFAGVRLDPVRVSPGEQAERVVERSAQVPDAIRYLVAAAILLILFTGVTRLVLRRRRRPVTGASEERSSVLDANDLFRWLKALLAARFLKHQGAPEDPLAALRGDPRWAHTVAIRDTYARYLRWSRDRGMPRRAGTTPMEHEHTVAAQVEGAGARADLSGLTGGYNVARYGSEPASAEQATAVRDAWRRLSAGKRTGRE